MFFLLLRTSKGYNVRGEGYCERFSGLSLEAVAKDLDKSPEVAAIECRRLGLVVVGSRSNLTTTTEQSLPISVVEELVSVEVAVGKKGRGVGSYWLKFCAIGNLLYSWYTTSISRVLYQETATYMP